MGGGGDHSYKMVVGVLVLCVLVAGSFVDVVNADKSPYDCWMDCKQKNCDSPNQPQKHGWANANECNDDCHSRCNFPK